MKTTHINDPLEPTVFAIFGGSGDLTWRKLLPALYDLSLDRSMPPHFAIIVLGRGKLAESKLRRHLREGVSRFSRRGTVKAAEWALFSTHIHYVQGDYGKPQTYTALEEHCTKLEKNGGFRHNVFFIWPRRPPCLLRSRNAWVTLDWRTTGGARGSSSKSP